MRLRVVFVGLVVAAALVGCTSSGETPPTNAAAPTTAPIAQDTTSASTPTTFPTATTTVTTAPDAVAFFKAQEPACRAEAERVGNPVVDPARFAGAKLVQRNTDGTALIEDGEGTQLIVDVSGGKILPPSGNAEDFMPDPYGFGCPPEVFVGSVA
jgi:ABC-type transport system substrate-binding protein